MGISTLLYYALLCNFFAIIFAICTLHGEQKDNSAEFRSAFVPRSLHTTHVQLARTSLESGYVPQSTAATTTASVIPGVIQQEKKEGGTETALN